MAAVCEVASVNIFLEARSRIRSDISSIIQCLNNKQVEMFEEIDRLEREFENKQKQKQRELNKLKSLKSQTEELGENNLLAIQRKLVGELELEIDALTLTNKLTPDYNISVVWGFSNRDLMRSINSSNVELITDTSADCLVSSDATDSSEDNTGLASPDSNWGSTKAFSPQELVDVPLIRFSRERPEREERVSRERPEREERVSRERPKREERVYRERPERGERLERDQRETRERPERGERVSREKQSPEHLCRYQTYQRDPWQWRPQSSDRGARGGYRKRGYQERRFRDGGLQRGEGGFRFNDRGTRTPRRPRYREHRRGSRNNRRDTDQYISD